METKAFVLKTQDGDYILWLTEKTAQKIARELQLNLKLQKPKIFGV